ncbi:histidine kinase [Tenacibaculum sp. IB213877]|uniref:histidine kinase n=1 Tax=Tenacibaculum sp. IB213877 TaxID=3097351 RepID=UPI002A59C3C3|nr:histidine kinase [Tenacibaculum sp. IB213877]MDY0781235.1 histidine kinase [Tenacibaculum sp. IB213877]
MFQKKYSLIVFIAILITIGATYTINKLISEKATIVSQSIAQRSFYKKYNNIQHQFKLLEKPFYEVKNIVSKQTSLEQITQKLKTLREIHQLNNSTVNSWFGIVKSNDIKVFEGKGLFNNDSTLKKEILLKQHTLSEQTFYNKIYKRANHSLVWRNMMFFNTAHGTVFYGYDLDLLKVQKEFRNIDVYAVSYAYVFNKEGLCLVHPDTSYVGKNVFKATPLTPKDTINIQNKYNERIITSEYLELDVINYTKPLVLFNDDFYVSINFLKSIYEEDVNKIKKYSSLIYITFTILLLFVFYYFALTVYSQFNEKVLLEKDKANLILEKEVYQKESALLQLQQLKNQINPHFLFNSLNSLYTLIGEDESLSKTFVIKLSKLYRYLINSPKDNIVEIKTELEFIKEYLFLQKIRFNTSIQWEIQMLKKNYKKDKIPYLSLQTLVENAIKHNITSKESPLLITITVMEEKVIVKNNYQLKKTAPKGNKFGLRYLQDIYKFYKNSNFKHYVEEGFFYCELPFLN